MGPEPLAARTHHTGLLGTALGEPLRQEPSGGAHFPGPVGRLCACSGCEGKEGGTGGPEEATGPLRLWGLLRPFTLLWLQLKGQAGAGPTSGTIWEGSLQEAARDGGQKEGSSSDLAGPLQIEQVSQLSALVDAQLDYHRQAVQILDELADKLKRRWAWPPGLPRGSLGPPCWLGGPVAGCCDCRGQPWGTRGMPPPPDNPAPL